MGSSEVIPLKRYSKVDVDRSAAALRRRIQDGLLSQLDLAQEMAAYVLRDEQGGYWFLDANSDQWYRFAQGDWQPAQNVPQTLEGMDGLASAPDISAGTEAVTRPFQETAPIQTLTDTEVVTAPWIPPPGLPNVQVPQVIRTVPLQAAPAPAEASSVEPWTLRWIDGPLAGRQEKIGLRVRIGRETDNDIELKLASVSRHHAVLEWTSSTYQITDLGSANGTFVNGTRIAQPTPLQSGDTVTLQEASFTLTAPESTTCPSCGHTLRPGTHFCGQCGARVG